MGVGKFYTTEEALTLLRNMSDFEDESTSESEIEGDSSDSSEYAPEQQYQVRTDSLLTVPYTWLINTLLHPYQARKGVGESTQAMLVLYVMSAKRHCQMLVLGTVTNPKSTPLTGVQYVSVHCVCYLW